MKRLVLYVGILLLATTIPALAEEGNLQKGIKAYKNRQYAETISFLRAELSKSPDSKEALYYLGMALWDTGNADSALIHLEKAWQRDPKNPEYTHSLGNLYLEKNMPTEAKKVFQAGLDAGKKGYKGRFYYGMGKADIAADSLNSAIVNLMHAREIDSKDAKVYVALGDAYAKQKINTVAIENYRKAVELDTSLVQVHYDLAKLLYKERQFNDALMEFRKVVDLNPQFGDAYFQIANLYYMGKRYPEAIQNGEEAAKIFSSNVGLTRLLAKLYYDTRDYAKTADAFQQLAAWDSLSAEEYVQWGRSSEALKRNPDAITELEKAVVMDSTLDLHFDIGTLLIMEQRYPEAIVHFEKKTQSDPQSASAYLNLGICNMALKKYPEAIKAYRKGVELKPDYVQGHLWLAQSYAMLDSLEQATAAYRVVAKLDSTNAGARRYIGFYYLMKKDYPAAISNLQRSAALEPNDAQVHLWLAQAYLLNHEGKQALVEYRRVLQLDPNNKEAQKRVKMLE
jgi:tetratricopeptide (TPR) repeat protein